MIPEWVRLLERAREHNKEAERLIEQSDRIRCQVTDSGGAQCTADGTSEHKHRIGLEDNLR